MSFLILEHKKSHKENLENKAEIKFQIKIFTTGRILEKKCKASDIKYFS